MQIPKFKHTVSPSMSGAYSTTQQQSQPDMRQAVQRNPSKYLSDPRAGQRNMQLEVQAVLDQAKPITAMATGMAQIGETFAKADAEEQLTTANLNLRTEVEQMLANMKAMPVAREQSEIDGYTGQVHTSLQPVHKTSYQSFNASLLNARDRLSKGMSRVARDAFLKGSVAYIAQAQAEAASVNRKQHIKYLQGRVYDQFEAAQTDGQIEEIKNSPHAQLAFDPMDLSKMAQKRHEALAVDYFATQIMSSESENQLETVRQRLEGQLGSETGEDGTWIPTRDQARATGHLEHMDGKARMELLGKIEEKMEAFEKEDEERLENNFKDLVDEIYANNGDPEKFNADLYAQMIADDEIAEDKIKALKDHQTTAIQAKGTVVASDPELENKILGDISNDDYSVENLQAMALEQGFKQKMIEERRKYDRTSIIWWDKNNPDGIKGHVAKQILTDAFIPSPQFLEFMPGQARANMMKRMNAAMITLYEYADELQQSDIPNKEVLDKIYDRAKELATDELNRTTISKTIEGVGNTYPQAFGGTEDQWADFTNWQVGNLKLGPDGNKKPTFDFVESMKPGPQRDQLATKFAEFGWEFKAGFIGERQSPEKLQEEIEAAGGADNWFQQELKKMLHDYKSWLGLDE